MDKTIILAAYASWIPLVVILFWWKKPRTAVPIALFAAFLLLPRVTCAGLVPVVGDWITKQTVPGLALLVGILVSDPRRLLRAWPSPLDIPMLLFVLMPVVSLTANRFEGSWDVYRQLFINFAGWLLPYMAGRLYLGDRDGPAWLMKSLVIAGLASIPIYVFEMVLGPDYYLSGLVFGIPPQGHMVARLGGWRPEGFQTSGLEVATWLALASTMAAWSWLSGAWPARPSLAWIPPVALALVTIASRGVYGYANLAIGLSTSVLECLTRSRGFLITLALLPLAYLAFRLTGAWDGKSLVDLVQFTGRADTVVYRFQAEDAYLKKVFDHNIWLGFGGVDSGIFDWYSQNHLWPDGWWIHQLRSGGVIGLSIAVLALFLWPSGLALALPWSRPGRGSPAVLAWGLALFLILHMIDSLHNMNYLTATPLIAGSLISLFQGRKSSRLEVASVTGPRSNAPTQGSRQTPLLVTIAILVVVEILGSIAKTPSPDPAQPTVAPTR